ncbi:MAG: hypothetical protein QOE51_873, partial [Actinoplanes sp.]|nr:hypothetical protein [Actinoplanes sp.]
MKYELTELLAASKENPPPPRHSADDVLAAGRKQQSRRRALFTSVGSAAAVAVVAAAVAVPQMLTRTSSPNQSTISNQSAAGGGAKKQAPFPYPAEAFFGNIAPFMSGDLSIGGAVQVTTSYQVAAIIAPGNGTPTVDKNGKVHQSANSVGDVVVYRAGVFNPSEAIKSGKKVTVSGNVGYYTASKETSPADPKIGTRYSNATLTWQYAKDSWAVVSVRAQAKLSQADMINLAQGVTPATATEQTVDFKLGFVPKGYKLEAAGSSDSSLLAPVSGGSFLRVVNGTTDYTGLTGPILDAPIVGDKQLPTLSLTAVPAWDSNFAGSTAGACDGTGDICFKSTADGKF